MFTEILLARQLRPLNKAQLSTYFMVLRATYFMVFRLISKSVSRKTGIVNNKCIVKFSNTLKVSLQATHALQRTKESDVIRCFFAPQDEAARKSWLSHIVQSATLRTRNLTSPDARRGKDRAHPSSLLRRHTETLETSRSQQSASSLQPSQTQATDPSRHSYHISCYIHKGTT